MLADAAGLRWEQHHALWRLGAVLVRGAGATQEARDALRSAHAYALEQGAVPLRRAIEETAALGRVSLELPAGPAGPTPYDGGLGPLTARELEVLALVVAHRTNAEIADELFISPKTVSVHVSNMLRKTETSSRRDLAALALRLGRDR